VRIYLAIGMIVVLLSLSMGQWLTLAAFKLNQARIAKTSCVNRYRPQMNCNGNCVFMKKLKQQEKEEQQQPAQLKLEISSIVISSRTFFVTAPAIPAATSTEFRLPFKSGEPIDRSYSFFHPPRMA
jgi:hypothetical protein